MNPFVGLDIILDDMKLLNYEDVTEQELNDATSPATIKESYKFDLQGRWESETGLAIEVKGDKVIWINLT